MRTIPQAAVVSVILYLSIGEGTSAPSPGGLDFEAVVAPQSVKVAQGRATSVLLALKITNQGKGLVIVDKYHVPRPSLTTQTGERVQIYEGRDGIVPPQNRDFTFLRGKRSTYILVDCAIYQTNGVIRMGGTFTDGSVWETGPLGAGMYKLSLSYKPKQMKLSPGVRKGFGDLNPWVGEIETKPVIFSLSIDK